MARARREMEEKIKVVDMVIEIRDARIPGSSINPLLAEVIGSKPKIIVLSKADKADRDLTERWLRKFEEEGHYAIALDLLHSSVSKIISKACLLVMSEKISKLKARGMKHVEIKAMVVGVPNVGKSTLINSVVRKRAARTADQPGVTKSLQWIKVSPDVALLDTPGVLWPKFEDQTTALKLAVCGSISDNVIPVEEVVKYALEYLSSNYREELEKRYDIVASDDGAEILLAIAKSRHFLNAEGEADLFRARNIVLNEIRDGLVGRFTLELPDEN